jgi:hypothetical protein
MSRRGADEISGNPVLQARMRRLRRQAAPGVPVTELSAATRDALIMRLVGDGYSPAQIGKAVGMTRRGAAMAIERIRDGRPGRVRAE